MTVLGRIARQTMLLRHLLLWSHSVGKAICHVTPIKVYLEIVKVSWKIVKRAITSTTGLW